MWLHEIKVFRKPPSVLAVWSGEFSPFVWEIRITPKVSYWEYRKQETALVPHVGGLQRAQTFLRLAGRLLLAVREDVQKGDVGMVHLLRPPMYPAVVRTTRRLAQFDEASDSVGVVFFLKQQIARFFWLMIEISHEILWVSLLTQQHQIGDGSEVLVWFLKVILIENFLFCLPESFLARTPTQTIQFWKSLKTNENLLTGTKNLKLWTSYIENWIWSKNRWFPFLILFRKNHLEF